MDEMKHFLLLFFWFFFAAETMVAQPDYFRYYDLVNRGEEVFIEHRDQRCYAYYDSALFEYRPFLKDCYVAAQMAWLNRDTLQFFRYLERGFSCGMPLTSVQAAPLLRHIDAVPSVYAEIQRRHASSYLSAVTDPQVADSIYLFYYISDSLKLGMGRDPEKLAQFDAWENRFRGYLYDRYLSKGCFPNERIIGVATAERYFDFLKRFGKKDLYPEGVMDVSTDYELSAKFSYNVLLHAYCSYSKYKEALHTALRNGYLQPVELAILQEINASWGRNDRNPWNDCKRPSRRVFFNVLSYSPMGINTFFDGPEDLRTVEQNRSEIHMQRYAVDVRKKALQREVGIWFFFDFIGRPG